MLITILIGVTITIVSLTLIYYKLPYYEHIRFNRRQFATTSHIINRIREGSWAMATDMTSKEKRLLVNVLIKTHNEELRGNSQRYKLETISQPNESKNNG